MQRYHLYTGIIAFAVSALSLSVYHFTVQPFGKTIQIEHVNRTPGQPAAFDEEAWCPQRPLDFTQTAEQVMPAVVHIKATRRSTARSMPRSPFEDFFRNDPFRDFFGPRFFRQESPAEPRVQMGQGSGVIVSEDGYIVTNNHVVADAEDLEVSLYDKRSFNARIVGTDPSTDLALLQIEADGLPTLPLANSDEVRIGEWVLAVGNPFNLNSTVTAGIVSAKGRSLNLLQEKFAVESFIQTDAAINPGNSGGALVDLNGALIGINTAIASPTGAYSGYGFAVPTNIVSKVMEDLMQYGVVQRGVLGVMIRSVDGNLQAEQDLSVTSGAYVDSLLENSAAARAGVQPGDVILQVDDLQINNSAALQEAIARHRPGDQVELLVDRNGKQRRFTVTLHNPRGETALIDPKKGSVLDVLGVELQTIGPERARRLAIEGGVLIKQLYNGKLRRSTDVREGFIITHIDGEAVSTVEEVLALLEQKKGGVLIEGVYEDRPGAYYYGLGI